MADVKLLPLPIPHCTYADHSYPAFKPQQMQAYARANVDAATEALRAEVERLRDDRDSWEQQASDRVADWHAEYLRAERLAEALRYCESWFERHSPTAALIGENGNAEHPMLTMIRSALAQEDRNG